jgi:hypothetical protein
VDEVNGLDALRMTVNLNAVLNQQLPLEQAVAAVVGPDVAHHLVDPEDILDLDPVRATSLGQAFGPLAAREPESWVLALPSPGSLGSLRGPKSLNQAALDVGEAVIGIGGGIALVPFRVGQAVQWRLFAAERPFAPPVPYDAERQLNEAVITAAQTLTSLDVAAGSRPRDTTTVTLASGYSPRQHATAARAARLITACDAALLSDGGAISAFEADARIRELRTVRAAAAQALCAAASWIGV